MRPTLRFDAPTVIVAGLLLAGCSGRPSESDIQKAYSESLNASLALFAAFGGREAAAPATSVKSVDSHGCERANGKPGYICTFNLEIELPTGQLMNAQETSRFVRGDRGWVVAAD